MTAVADGGSLRRPLGRVIYNYNLAGDPCLVGIGRVRCTPADGTASVLLPLHRRRQLLMNGRHGPGIRRVMLVSHGLPPEMVGGVENHTLWLARELSRRDIEVLLFTRRAEDERQESFVWENRRDGVVVCSVPRRGAEPEQDAGMDAAFEEAVARFRPQLVHFQHLIGLSVNLPYVAAKWRLPIVLSVHDHWYACPRVHLLRLNGSICQGPERGKACSAYCGETPERAVRRYLEMTGIFRLASRVLMPSLNLKDRYQAFGFPVDRVIVAPPGIERPFRRNRRLRAAEAPLVIATMGSLLSHKGIDVIISAVRHLSPDDVELRVFGNSYHHGYAAYLRRLAGDAPNIRFMGQYDPDRLDEIYDEVDIIAVPSVFPETYSFVAREAIARGVPVLASSVGALEELASYGCLLLPAGDVEAWTVAIRSLARDRSQLADLKHRTGGFVGPSHAGYADLVLQVYQEAIAEKVGNGSSCPPPPVVSICIVTYGSRSVIDACLESIASCVGLDHEVIVVDNASPDGTARHVAGAYPWVKLICNDRNEGYTRAANQAVHAAKGRYILFLNPDARLYPGVVEAMVNRMEASPWLGALTCKLMNPGGVYQLSGARLFRPFDIFRIYGFTGSLERRLRPRSDPHRYAIPDQGPDEDGLQLVDYTLGACLMTRRDVIDNVGVLDEATFMYGDDVDWCLRARLAGYHVAVDTRVTAFHEGGSTHSMHDRRSMTLKAYQFLLRKYYGRPGRLAAALLGISGHLRRWAGYHIPLMSRPLRAVSLLAMLPLALFFLLGELMLSLALLSAHRDLRRRIWHRPPYRAP